MQNKKVPFPRYLNAKKLFYKWEYDVVAISAGTGAGAFIMLLWFGMSVILALFVSMGITVIVLKRYIKYFKKAREGYVYHLLYSKGYLAPFKKFDVTEEFENSLIPYGFENEFVN